MSNMSTVQDKTMDLLKTWIPRLEGRHISVVLSGHNNDSPMGGTDKTHFTKE